MALLPKSNLAIFDNSASNQLMASQMDKGFSALAGGLTKRWDTQRQDELLKKQQEAEAQKQNDAQMWRETQMKAQIASDLTKDVTDVGQKIKIYQGVLGQDFKPTLDALATQIPEIKGDPALQAKILDTLGNEIAQNKFSNALELNTRFTELGGQFSQMTPEQKEAFKQSVYVVTETGKTSAHVRERMNQLSTQDATTMKRLFGAVDPKNITSEQLGAMDKYNTMKKQLGMVDEKTIQEFASIDFNIARLEEIKQKLFNDKQYADKFGMFQSSWDSLKANYMNSKDMKSEEVQKDIKGLIDIMYDISGKQVSEGEIKVAIEGMLPDIAKSAPKAVMAIDLLQKRLSGKVAAKREALRRAGKYETVNDLDIAYSSLASQFTDGTQVQSSSANGGPDMGADIVQGKAVDKPKDSFVPLVKFPNDPQKQARYEMYVQQERAKKGLK